MSLTPDTIATIKRNSGKMPVERIATACGISVGLVERIAREQGWSLRLRPARDVSELPSPRAPIERRGRDLPPEQQRTVGVSTYFCEATAAVLREKARERVVRPAALLRQVFEGAIVLGMIDELASAAKSYRPGVAVSGDQP